MGADTLMTRGIPLRFMELDSGCYVCTSHRTNQDGYVRLSFDGKMKMLHRVLWEDKYGQIPEGFEVHHTCNVRSCCNVGHLEILLKSVHIQLTNRERYEGRRVSLQTCDWSRSVHELAEEHKCSIETVYRHKRVANMQQQYVSVRYNDKLSLTLG